MQEILKIAGLLVLSAIKFFLAPSTVVLSGYSFWESIAITCVGGFMGFFVFFYFGKIIQGFFRRVFKLKAKKKFSKRNRMIVKIKRSYGLWGLAFLSPCLFSIPIGSVLASIYYGKHKLVVPIFMLMIVFWSFVLTGITVFIDNA